MNKISANRITSSAALALHTFYKGNSFRYVGEAGNLYRDFVSVPIVTGLVSTTTPWPIVTMKPQTGAVTYNYFTDGTVTKKDSGTAVTDWGIVEPGSQATLSLGTGKVRVGDAFDATTGWAISSMGNMALSVDATNKVEGTNSVKMTNASAVTNADGGSIRKTAAVDFSTFSDASDASGNEYMRFWFAASDISLVKSLELIFGIDGWNQTFRYRFDNTAEPLVSAPSEGTFFELKVAKWEFQEPNDRTKTWANVNRLRINIRFTKNVPVGSEFWFDDLALRGGYDIEGRYQFKYTLVQKSGSIVIEESNPASLATSPEDISTSRIPVTVGALPSGGIKRVYRSFAEDFSQFFYDGEAASGVTTYSSEKKDLDLGSLLAIDSDVPPAMSDLVGPHFDRVFGISASVPDQIVFSKAKLPNAFPPTNYLLAGVPGDSLQRLVLFEGVLYAFTITGIYIVQGTDESSFVAFRTRAERGTVSKRSVALSDSGVYYLAQDGIRFFDGLQSAVLSTEIDPVFYSESTLGIDSFNMAQKAKFRGAYFDGKYFLAYCQGAATQNDRVLIFDEASRRWFSWTFNSARDIFVEKDNNYLVLSAQDGFTYYGENGLKVIDGPDGLASVATTIRMTYDHGGIKVVKDVYPDLDVPASGGVVVTPIVDGTTKTAVTFAQSSDRTIRRLRLSANVSGRVFEWKLSSGAFFRAWGLTADILDFQRSGYRHG